MTEDCVVLQDKSSFNDS